MVNWWLNVSFTVVPHQSCRRSSKCFFGEMGPGRVPNFLHTIAHHPCLLPGCFKIRLCRRSLRQIEQHKFASITHSMELASGSSANRTIQTWRHVLSLKLDDLPLFCWLAMVYLWVSLLGWLPGFAGCWGSEGRSGAALTDSFINL